MLQDLWLRLCHCQQQRGDRVDQGPQHQRRGEDQEQRDCKAPEPAARQAALQHAGGGCHQGACVCVCACVRACACACACVCVRACVHVLPTMWAAAEAMGSLHACACVLWNWVCRGQRAALAPAYLNSVPAPHHQRGRRLKALLRKSMPACCPPAIRVEREESGRAQPLYLARWKPCRARLPIRSVSTPSSASTPSPPMPASPLPSASCHPRSALCPPPHHPAGCREGHPGEARCGCSCVC